MARTIIKLKLKKSPDGTTIKKRQPIDIKLKQVKKKPSGNTPKTKFPTRKEQSQNLLKILEENHSGLFPTDGTPPKPWKMYIANDIKERYKVTQGIVQRTLALWRNENNEAYRAVLVAGADRYDLDGKANGTVETTWVPVAPHADPA